MSFHRMAVAALALAWASGAQITQAQACDQRILGSCPDAPITHPGVLVEAGQAPPSAEPVKQTTRRSVRKRRSARHRIRHRHRTVVIPRARPGTAKAEKVEPEVSNKIKTAESTRGIDLKRTGAPGNARDNIGISEKAVAEAWARVPIAVPSSLPRAAPTEPVATQRPEQPAQTADAPPRAEQPVQTADAAPTQAPVRVHFVQTTSIKPPSDAKPAEAVRPAETAQRAEAPESPHSSMTTLRAIALTCAGLLALGTAVRLVL